MSDEQSYCSYYKCSNQPYRLGLCSKHCAKRRAYRQQPEVKAKRRAYRQQPEVKAKQRAYRQQPEVKAKQRAGTQPLPFK